MELKRRLTTPVTHIIVGGDAYLAKLVGKSSRGNACYVYSARVTKSGTYDTVGLSTDGETAAISEACELTVNAPENVEVTLVIKGKFYGSDNVLADWFAGYSIDTGKLALASTVSSFVKTQTPALARYSNASALTVGDSLRITAQTLLYSISRGFVVLYDGSPCAYFDFANNLRCKEVAGSSGCNRVILPNLYKIEAEGAVSSCVPSGVGDIKSIEVGSVDKLECSSKGVWILSGGTLKKYSTELIESESISGVSDFSVCENYLVLSKDGSVSVVTAEADVPLGISADKVIAAERSGLVFAAGSGIYKFDERLKRAVNIGSVNFDSVFRAGDFLVEVERDSYRAFSFDNENFPAVTNIESFAKLSGNLGFDGGSACDVFSGQSVVSDSISGGISCHDTILYTLRSDGAFALVDCGSVPSFFGLSGSVLAYVAGGTLHIASVTYSTAVDVTLSEAQTIYLVGSSKLTSGNRYVTIII